MAVVAVVRSETSVGIDISWSALAATDTGAPVEMPDVQDFSVQFQFVAGTTPSAQLEGSNDGTNWHLLTDPQGVDIVKTLSDLEQVSENPRYVRPNCTAGTGVNLNVLIHGRRNR